MDSPPKLKIGDRVTDRGGWTGNVIQIIESEKDWLYEIKGNGLGSWIILESQLPAAPSSKT